jgi:hypothetical protein
MNSGVKLPDVTFKYRVRTDGKFITYVDDKNGGANPFEWKDVMRKWMIDQGIHGDNSIKFIPDGNGEFTRQMGMLVDKSNLGFGMRSWRYAMVVNDGVVEAFFEEPGREDNCDSDPYGVTSPENIMEYLANATIK